MREVNNMLYRILRGPNFGQTKHLPQSQEISLAVLLGDLEPVEGQPSCACADATANQSRQGLPTVEPGWSIVRRTDAQGLVTYNIVETLGTGERITYKTAPPARRVTCYDSDKDIETVEWVESPCPKELIAKWETLSRESGTNIDHECAGELKRQEQNKLQLAIDEQKHKTVKLY